MKKIISFLIGACFVFALGSCTCAAPEADEEGALIKHEALYNDAQMYLDTRKILSREIASLVKVKQDSN